MKRFVEFLKKFTLSLIIALLFNTVAHGITLRMVCRAKGKEMELCKELVEEWKKAQGCDVDVEIVCFPHSSSECFALYQQLLSSKECDLDIILLDIAWVGVFSEYLEDLSKYNIVDSKEIDDYFPAIKSSILVKNELIALPLYTDVGVLFYRKDLLQKYGYDVPDTWEDLYRIALDIQNKERDSGQKMYGYVFQAKAMEILSCVAVEAIDSFGGFVVDQNCTVGVTSDNVINSMRFMQKVTRDISPDGVTNHNEEDSRAIFQLGMAVFMRNWPYAAIANDCSAIAGQVGMTTLPKGDSACGHHSGALGGWNLGIPRLSAKKELAARLVAFMTSKNAQKMRAIKGHYAPPSKSLYDDCDVLEGNPFFKSMRVSLESAVRRPSVEFGENYPKASRLLFCSVNTILSNSKNSSFSIEKELKRLEKKLKRTICH